MPRYIDAEKIERWMHREDHGTPDERWRPESEFAAIIDNQPTADVQEVKHGTWLSVEDDVIFECSVCGCEISTSWNYDQENMWQYCPHCGAKMDEEAQ